MRQQPNSASMIFVREVLSYQEYHVGDPGPGEVLVRNTAIGVNYIDTYYRSGLYPAELPLIPGDQEFFGRSC